MAAPYHIFQFFFLFWSPVLDGVFVYLDHYKLYSNSRRRLRRRLCGRSCDADRSLRWSAFRPRHVCCSCSISSAPRLKMPAAWRRAWLCGLSGVLLPFVFQKFIVQPRASWR